jgi:DNA-binding transcriptional LysR family regulator
MPWVNPHFLFLFYHVGLHGGLSVAVRKIPYSIGLPALSKAMAELEAELGTQLFHRRPFRLTQHGQKLFAVVRTSYEQLARVVEEIQADLGPLLRVAGPCGVLQLHLPGAIPELQKAFPGLRVTLRAGLRAQIDAWFAAQEIDLAVTVLEGKPPAHCRWERLLRLPMQLLVPHRSPIRAAEQLWAGGRAGASLVCPAPEDALTRCFLGGLERRRIQWPVRIDADSLDVVEACVAAGVGVGLSAAIPGRTYAKKVRPLPLPGFPELNVGLLWKEKPSPPTLALMKVLRARARELLGSTAGAR